MKYDEHKVDNLMDSISDSAFWDDILKQELKPVKPYIPTAYDKFVELMASILLKICPSFAIDLSNEIIDMEYGDWR